MAGLSCETGQTYKQHVNCLSLWYLLPGRRNGMKNNFNTAWLTEVLECAQGCFQREVFEFRTQEDLCVSVYLERQIIFDVLAVTWCAKHCKSLLWTCLFRSHISLISHTRLPTVHSVGGYHPFPYIPNRFPQRPEKETQPSCSTIKISLKELGIGVRRCDGWFYGSTWLNHWTPGHLAKRVPGCVGKDVSGQDWHLNQEAEWSRWPFLSSILIPIQAATPWGDENDWDTMIRSDRG